VTYTNTERRKLPDGRTVYSTLYAASRWGVSQPTVTAIAEREGVERFAGRVRGGIAHYYLAEDVERIRSEREATAPLFEEGEEFVPAPYKKKNART
jgi:hypothetical protein